MALVHRVGWHPEFLQRSGWLWPLARAAARLAQCRDFPELDQLDAVYAAEAVARGAPPLRFRPDVRSGKRGGARPIEQRYDGRIALCGEVPTRPRDWHDLLNALCFATFPHAKHALHTRQYRALTAAAAPAPTRTREQDALTLFDEGGIAIAVCAEMASELRAALAAGDLDALVAAERSGHARTVPLGHALFEHMVEGLPCPGGSARLLALDSLPEHRDALLDAVDRAVAGELSRADAFVAAREHLHLRLDVLPAAQRAWFC